MRLLRTLLLLSAATVFARESHHDDHWEYHYEHVDDQLSFGQHEQIWGASHDHNNVPGWHLISEGGHNPDILSDRIILTPPHYGNRRGAIWADRPETHPQWTAEFEFRASGPERGSGNLQLWYAKNGQQEIGTSSIYTVGKFDGLALVISQYGGYGGSIRGFLNDGQTSYKDHHHVDRLAFGHCDFSYRNLGHFTHISMKQMHDGFEVEVDKRPCFKTHKVKLPPGYFFGITAASAENPDSFEAKSFIVSKATEGEWEWHDQWHQGASHQPPRHDSHTTPNDGSWYWISMDDATRRQIKDAPASSFKTDDQRFEDLHNRLSIVNSALDILYNDLTHFKEQTEKRHEELIGRLDDMHAWLTPTHDHVESTRKEIDDMKREVKAIKADVESKDYREHLVQLQEIIKEGHAAVMVNMPHAVNSMIHAASPRLGFFAFLIIASQIGILASYIIYRRRRDQQPKKYL